MSSKEKSATTGSTVTDATKAQSTATTQIEKENAQGFRGTEVDSTPNENYTVQGVISGAPTPETDAELAKQTRIESGLGLSALEASAREKEAGGKK
jgi:hypothetical protein